MNATINIGSRAIGVGKPAFLIAEIGQAHDGSLGIAHAFIDAVADSGADAIKFQTHIAEAESTLDEPFRVKFSRQDSTRYAYWKRMEFTPEQWQGLAQHAQERGLCFLSSPFSIDAVELLTTLGVPAWKIGSGEIRSRTLLEAMMATGKPLLLSTGMSHWEEIDHAVKHLQGHRSDFVLMQCTSQYPTPLQSVGLNVLSDMQTRYRCLVGLSDHSGTPFPALAALNRGACVIEVHVTFDRRFYGPDTPASVTFDELKLIARARDAFIEMERHPVDKDQMAEQLSNLRTTFGKSIATNQALPAGTILTEDMLTFKKPASGIPPDAITNLLGKRLVHNVTPDRLLRWEDINA